MHTNFTGIPAITKCANMKRTEYINGIHVEFLPINQAFSVLWFDSVLRIFNKKQDALDYANKLLLK